MSTIVSAQRARIAALIAAALIVVGCAESGPLTAPARLTGGATHGAQTPISVIDRNGPTYSGYALASGRVPDSTATSVGK